MKVKGPSSRDVNMSRDIHVDEEMFSSRSGNRIPTGRGGHDGLGYIQSPFRASGQGIESTVSQVRGKRRLGRGYERGKRGLWILALKISAEGGSGGINQGGVNLPSV